MKKSIKHFFFSTVLITVCFLLTAQAAAMRTGDIVAEVQKTDIRAFIDGYEIPAYNINNKLGIVAEDLLGYGFNVEWNQENKTLSVRKNALGVYAPLDVGKSAGKMPVYFTDIVTFVDGETVESFNIGGRTIIFFSELQRYGTYVYDNDCRASMISTDRHSFAKTTISSLPRKIIHAGGEIGGLLGSNSLEALENTYQKGFRVIEMDFVLSSDKSPVCLHNWSQYYSNYLGSNPVSKAEFEQIKIFEKYTSLSLDRLVEWMKSHPDVYIVTDIKEDNVNVLRHIADEHPEIVSRIIPQIYQYEEYLPVRTMGYSNIVLTLYCLPSYNDKVNSKYNAAFALKYGLLAVTGDMSLANQRFVNEYVKAGVPLYVHTVNDISEQQKYISMGVTGVYTDYAE